jgi:hypothetical protein
MLYITDKGIRNSDLKNFWNFLLKVPRFPCYSLQTLIRVHVERVSPYLVPLLQELVGEWSKVAYRHMTYHQPDYELDNGKPRPVNQSIFHELSMLEYKSTNPMQGPNGEESN